MYREIDIDIEISGISIDSRHTKENNLFVCLEGTKYDGHEFVEEAINNGAIAIVANRKLNTGILEIIVDDTTKELARISDIFFNRPSTKMDIIGVTGTDGKTTTASIISYLLSSSFDCAYIGTNGVRFKNKVITTNNTTPNAVELNNFLNNLRLAGIDKVAMEVSSHAIASNRIGSINFEVGVFTNLSVEHLDFHKTLDNYFESKNSFMKSFSADKVIFVNSDDAYADKIIETAKADVVTYGINSHADIRAINIRKVGNYTLFDLYYFHRYYKDLKTNLLGDYNILNLIAAIGVAKYMGTVDREMFDMLERIPRIDGRYEKIDLGQEFDCIVDFAHTPNALDKLLTNVKATAQKNIILVCGSAGEKDKVKRKLMGEIATAKSSLVIFTSEDPRSEDPNDIINDMLETTNNVNYIKILDRKKAIQTAIEIASKDDIVLITGKGNESTQTFGTEVIYHNDIEIAKEFIADLKIFANNDINYDN